MLFDGFFDNVAVGGRSEPVVAVDSLADIVGPHGYPPTAERHS